MKYCPAGVEVTVTYSCRQCHTGPLHRGDHTCTCSTQRPEVTQYATLCALCAEMIDMLMMDTRLGRVHRQLVQEARMTYMPSSDD